MVPEFWNKKRLEYIFYRFIILPTFWIGSKPLNSWLYDSDNMKWQSKYSCKESVTSIIEISFKPAGGLTSSFVCTYCSSDYPCQVEEIKGQYWVTSISNTNRKTGWKSGILSKIDKWVKNSNRILSTEKAVCVTQIVE